MGRFIVPGGMVRMNGSMKSHQERMISSSVETTRSSTVLSELPVRRNSASTIGIDSFENSLYRWTSMVRCRKRATAALSE
jgi:hypothetical protein